MKFEKLQFGADRPLPYLNHSIIEEFSQIVVISEEGAQFRLNHLLLVSWSPFAKHFIKGCFCPVNFPAIQSDDVVISTNFTQMELKMLHNFIMRGDLPCSEDEILNGTLNPEIDMVFTSFGINLNLILNSKYIKIEQDNLEDVCDQKMEVSDDNISSNFTANQLDTDFQGMSVSAGGSSENPRKRTRKRAYSSQLKKEIKEEVSQQIDDHFTMIENLSEDEYAEMVIEEEGEEDFWEDDYVNEDDETKTMPKAKKGKGSSKSSKMTVVSERSCTYCPELFKTDYKLKQHVNETHVSHKIRGLKNKVKHKVGGDGGYQFTSHKLLLDYQTRFKDVFSIQVPPPDFTEEDFKNFKFPKPIEEFEVVPEKPAQQKDVVKGKGATECGVCDEKVPTATGLIKDHYVKVHTTHYRCTFDGCDYAIQKYESKNEEPLFKLARHLYYHERKPPQYKYPHECISCGYTTPYTEYVENHVKRKGPFHNNKCPKCDFRASNRPELTQHMETAGHQGEICGLCGDVFEDVKLMNKHRLYGHGKREPPKPRSKLCEDCGKVFHSLSGIYHHIKTTHEAPGSFPCDKCDRIFDHKNALAGHKKNVHNKLPCTFCGKLFPGYRLKVHINAVHTEEHLKPFLCQVCQKGFATEGRLNDHMNIHTGNRPHVCKYCGRGFADNGNMRMHEKTTHEGYKRAQKGSKTVVPSFNNGPDPLGGM